MRRNDEEKRNRPSVHDREPKPRGRNRAGTKSRRQGYPSLFLGTSTATKILTEIASLQPVAINDLPECQKVTDANLGYTVRRLIALGLVRRYRRPNHLDRYLLALDKRHPLAEAVRDVLRSLAAANGLAWTPAQAPPEDLTVQEGPNVSELRLFGRRPRDVETIFGHPNRTLALLVLGTLGACDPSTVARIASVQTDGDMHRLLDPLEADGILISDMFGSIRLYALADTPWKEALENLVRQTLRKYPRLASEVAPARTVMLHGQHSSRVHLRGLLGLEPLRRQRKRRKRH